MIILLFLALLGIFSSCEAKLYGSYSKTGARRPSGVRFSSRLAYNAYGRKLLQEEERDPRDAELGRTNGCSLLSGEQHHVRNPRSNARVVEVF